MTKRMLAMTSMTALIVLVTPIAASTRTVGVLAGVDLKGPPTLQLATKAGEAATATVRTDEKTAYMKWVTHRPWQANERIDTNALMLGRCVEAEMSDNNVAKVVRVSDEPAGSVFDPCKGRR